MLVRASIVSIDVLKTMLKTSHVVENRAVNANRPTRAPTPSAAARDSRRSGSHTPWPYAATAWLDRARGGAGRDQFICPLREYPDTGIRITT